MDIRWNWGRLSVYTGQTQDGQRTDMGQKWNGMIMGPTLDRQRTHMGRTLDRYLNDTLLLSMPKKIYENLKA